MRKVTILGLTVGYLLVSSASAGEIPQVQEIGTPVFLEAFNGARPDIACDSLGQPHGVVEDANKHNPEWRFYDMVGSQWRATPFNLLNYYSSGDEFGNPHVEVSNEGVAWYSGRMSSLRTALGWGMGNVVRTEMTSNPGASLHFFRDSHGTKTPLGDVSLDPSVANRASVMIQMGPYKTYEYHPDYPAGTFPITDVGSGRLALGNGGEKVAFRISHANSGSANTWHGATEQFYVNSKLGSSLIWANWNSDPSMWDDGCYPGLGTDSEDTDVAYMACDYKMSGYPPYGIYINIFNPNINPDGMAFGHDPLQIDPNGTSGLRRYPPRWAPAKGGGAWLCWTRNSTIMIRYIPADLKRDYPGQPYAENLAKCGPEISVGAGTRGSIASDPDGNLHLLYWNNGMVYQKVTVNQVAETPLLPAQDFDGDGADDVAMFSAGTWYIRYSTDIKTMNGAANTPNYFKFLGQAGDIPVPGNYDGNAANGAELAVYRPETSEWTVNYAAGQVSTVYGLQGDTPVPGDYNGDGTNDFAVTRIVGDQMHWFANGIFTDVPFGIPGDEPICADYDGDGKTDLAVARADGNSLRWLIRFSSNEEVVNLLYGLAATDQPMPQDYDNDGRADLAVFRAQSGLWIYDGLVDGHQEINWGAAGGDVPVLGNFDGEGKADITIYRPANRSWYIRSSAISNNLIESAPIYLGTSGSQPVIGDYDGDNIKDPCTYDAATASWSMWLSGATGAARNEPLAFPFGLPGDVAVPADYDADGTTDVAIFRPFDGQWWMYGSSWGLMHVPSWGTVGDTPIPADYDGDGRADWAIYRRHAGSIWWYIHRTEMGYLAPFPFGRDDDEPVVDDYDGDGVCDIAVVRTSAGPDMEWHRWLSGSGYNTFTFGLSTDTPIHGHFDDDNKADVGVYRPSDGSWHVVSTKNGYSADIWGGVTDIPTPGDFDGDGTFDLTIFRPESEATWYVNQSSSPGALMVRGPIKWAFSGTDQPIGGR